jgi:hypothetical protein
VGRFVDDLRGLLCYWLSDMGLMGFVLHALGCICDEVSFVQGKDGG